MNQAIATSFLGYLLKALFMNVMMPIPFLIVSWVCSWFVHRDDAYGMAIFIIFVCCAVWSYRQIIPDLAAKSFLKENNLSIEDIRQFRNGLRERREKTVVQRVDQFSYGEPYGDF